MNNAKITTLLEQLLKEFQTDEKPFMPESKGKFPTIEPDSELTRYWQNYQINRIDALDALKSFIQRFQQAQLTRATVIASIQEDGCSEPEAQAIYSRMRRFLCDVSLNLDLLKLTPQYQDTRQAKVKRN